MLELICIDVDGTLVGSDGLVNPAVWAAAGRLRAAGVHLALCSGRPALAKALAYARELDPHGWHIFQNGASVVQVGSGQSLSEPLPAGALEALVTRARQTGRLLEVYTDDAYAVELDNALAREHADLLGLPFDHRDLMSLPGQVVRVQWVLPQAELAALLAEPHAGLELHPASSPVMPGVAFVSVTRAGVNKGSAVRAVAGAYGVPLARTMMVGDGHNDVQAMRVVGVPVAMGNADAEARAAAAHFVGHVDRLGLVEAFDLAARL